jgi:hypothetical protein
MKSHMHSCISQQVKKVAILSNNFCFQLCNYDGPAVIRCSLYTTHPVKSQRTPHTHRLVVRSDNEDKDDPHELPVSPELGNIVM